jgi:hypothetical protein
MYSFKDRLIDWANGKGAWTHILMAAGIALIITAIILAVAMPSKDSISANAQDIGALHTTVNSVVGQLGLKASQADLELKANQADLDDVINVIGSQAGDINSLGDRVAALETINCSLPEAYLTGTFGNYTLHVSGEPGNYTAIVHLVYSPPMTILNATNYGEAIDFFYTGINWTAANSTSYIPTVTFNGTSWGISEVWFNVGVFVLTDEAEIPVPVALNITPSFAYVEIYRI